MEIKESLSRGLSHLTRFERVLAAVCGLIPLVLLWADSFAGRNSISAYFDMEENQWFYFPLTVAAMLFVVNGIVRKKHIYNVVLGGALAGVILFNHDDFTVVHAVFAVAFFAGNALVIFLFSDPPRVFKILFGTLIALVMAVYFLVDWVTLFWAESGSLLIIAGHFIADSVKWVPYRAT